MSKCRTAILISGRGSNMSALIEAARMPDFPAQIALVASNVPGAGGLLRAQAEGIAIETVDHKLFGRDREAFERALDHSLRAHRIELVCLAGFLRLLTPWFVNAWQGRLINVHPALLPAFKGLDTHARALAAGVRKHGASVHHVTAGMDEGPIILQGEIAVMDNDTPDTLAKRVLDVEHKIYPRALRDVAAKLIAER
jgi:phosphoribosylglycinamide formyltransferase-1